MEPEEEVEEEVSMAAMGSRGCGANGIAVSDAATVLSATADVDGATEESTLIAEERGWTVVVTAGDEIIAGVSTRAGVARASVLAVDVSSSASSSLIASSPSSSSSSSSPSSPSPDGPVSRPAPAVTVPFCLADSTTGERP